MHPKRVEQLADRIREHRVNVPDVNDGETVTSTATFTVEYDQLNTPFNPGQLSFDVTFAPQAWLDAVAEFEELARAADINPQEFDGSQAGTTPCPPAQNCEGAIMAQALAIAFAIYDGLEYGERLADLHSGVWQQYAIPPDLAATSSGEGQ